MGCYGLVAGAGWRKMRKLGGWQPDALLKTQPSLLSHVGRYTYAFVSYALGY